ncbi:Ubiquitin-conjugating enzyme E2 Q2 [Cichlidogyrus casuarinus]|uniref:Ubiquitin-conjugating enzyme E2 Q2 n=1 Tax=Cichlidogyrus casuarinus TaxID=1844966 RepID=A0ABD2QG09_9PLAT
MALTVNLKDEQNFLTSIFHKTHPHFRIISFKFDEIVCRFVKFPNVEILGNIPLYISFQDSYPRDTPVWFLSSDYDDTIWNAIEKLQTYGQTCKLISKQLKCLIYHVCTAYCMNLFEDYFKLCPDFDPSCEQSTHYSSMDVSPDLDEDSMSSGAEDTGFEDEDTLNFEPVMSIAKETRSLSEKDAETLEKVKSAHSQITRDETSKAYIPASDRIMKELRSIYQSDTYRSGIYSVDLVNDSLYDWDVKIFKFDPDSKLAHDLKNLHPSSVLPKGISGPNHVALQILFKTNFPFQPPFVRVKYPKIHGGYVLDGGAICMELLTNQGWSSAYNIESMIVQICATLVKGTASLVSKTPKLTSKAGVLEVHEFEGDINRPSTSKESDGYSLQKAQRTYRSIVRLHQKKGWFTPDKKEG